MNYRPEKCKEKKLYICCCLFLCLFLSGCNRNTTKSSEEEDFQLQHLAKGDMDNVLDAYVEQNVAYMRELMEKLYKRNPRELKKSNNSAEENIRRLLEVQHNWHFQELDNKKGIEAIRLTFSDEFQGDRVFAFVAGLSSMIMSAYEYKSDFYMFDSVEPQKLYNAARNIEIAVWKLGHDVDVNGELFLYSNSLGNEVSNLSYERLFGKLIALQDSIALIMEGQTNRIIKKVLQKMATAVFLPI